MANPYFAFKQFTIWQDQTAMKVTTDACLFGAWVSATIQHWMASRNPDDKATSLRLADVGAGTGLLSLMIHQKNPTCTIEALEIDPLAAEQARQNFSTANAMTQLSVVTADVNNFFPVASYDLIVSNPPFYQDDLKAATQKRNWAFHDETLSLSQLLSFIVNNMSSDGLFFLLFPYRREQEIELLMQKSELRAIKKIQVTTSSQHPPHRILLAGQRQEAATAVPPFSIDYKSVCITDDEGRYSQEFAALLKDFYLTL